MTRGGVYLRGKIWWLHFYWQGKNRFESSGSTDKKDAQLLLAKRLGEIGADVAGVKRWPGPGAEKRPVSDLLHDLVQDQEVTGRRGLVTVQGRVAVLLRSFHGEVVRDIDTARLRRFVQERQRAGYAPATIRLELSTLHRAFVLAFQDGKLAHVPAFPQIEVDNARQGFFDPLDFEAVCAYLTPVLADLARFAYLSGWRRQEVQELRWSEVSSDRTEVRLPPERSKSRKGRVLPLVGELAKIIERRWEDRLKAMREHDTIVEHVFHRAGKPIKAFKVAWRTACRAAGVAEMVFHDLRRTAVRNLVRAGVPEAVCMAMTGHRTRSVFDRYNITDDRDLRVAQEKVQGYLEGEKQEPRTVVPLGRR